MAKIALHSYIKKSLSILYTRCVPNVLRLIGTRNETFIFFKIVSLAEIEALFAKTKKNKE